MKTSERGLAIIKEFEGLRLRAYLCPANVWTIGYGHTSAAGHPPVTPGMAITVAEAEKILRRDLVKYEQAVETAVKVPLTQGQFDACVSLCYNIGPAAFARSTVVRRINARRFAEVPAAFMMWTKAGGRELPGLVRRRRAETALWRSLPETGEIAGRADGEVEEVAAEVAPTQSPAVLTTGGLVAAGGVVAPVVSGIANPWQLAGLVFVVVAVGIAAWLLMSGRVVINRGAE